MSQPTGSIYLLHFDRPIAHAQHYLGWTNGVSVDARVEAHRDGTSGSKLPMEFFRRGIGFVVARTWSDVTRRDERYLKDLRSARKRLCPICNGGHVPRVRRLER